MKPLVVLNKNSDISVFRLSYTARDDSPRPCILALPAINKSER